MKKWALLLHMMIGFELILIGCDTCEDSCKRTAKCYAEEYGRGDEQKNKCLEECSESSTECQKCEDIMNADEVEDRCNSKCSDTETKCIDCIMKASCEDIIIESKCAGECL